MAAGALLSQRHDLDPHAVIALLLLLGASACLYSAGMVWNDFFDVEEDRRQRPFRPIPSGRILRSTAGWLGAFLLLLGLGLAAGSTIHAGWQPLLVAVPLAGCILLYDAWLKRTWVGPLAMGACRFLNVLLGTSAQVRLPTPELLYLASIIGVYIVGVTWFARTEATESRRGMLIAAAAVMGMAAVMALGLVTLIDPATPWGEYVFPSLLLAWTLVIGRKVWSAIERPLPERVQQAIKWCVLGLIPLDASLAFLFAGWAGLAILLLLLPGQYLGRWVYST
jgi:4-hydroxybenzoate polyprenyltransferase